MAPELTEDQELSRLFSRVPDSEMKIVIAQYLRPFGYVQTEAKGVYLAFRNEELDLNIRVRYDKRHSFRIQIKRGIEWKTVDANIQRHNIAESVKSQGVLEFRQLIWEGSSQLLLPLS